MKLILALSIILVLLISGCSQQIGQFRPQSTQTCWGECGSPTPISTTNYPPNSAVAATKTPAATPCSPNWNCTPVGPCTADNLRKATCIDLNNCSSMLSKPESIPCKFIFVDHIDLLTRSPGDRIDWTLTLADKNNRNMVTDGKAIIEITDRSGKSLYRNEVIINNKDFSKPSQDLEIYGYKKSIPLSEVSKSMLDSYGSLMVTFDPGNGQSLAAKDYFVSVPKYTDAEIKAIYEDKWRQSAKQPWQTISKGNFEVTLVRFGYFTHLDYSKEVTDFRIDLKVKNIDPQSESFSTYDAKMVIGSSQYEYGYGSKIETSGIYPGVVKEGYILFENVPAGLSGPAKIIAGSAYWTAIDTHRYESILYTFDVQL